MISKSLTTLALLPLTLSPSKGERREHAMSFYVYILRCADGSYYTGHTDNLEQRVAAHEAGAISRYTRSRRPVKLAFQEDFPSREEAFWRERQIKGWTRRKRQALIKGDWGGVRRLSRAHGSTGSP